MSHIKFTAIGGCVAMAILGAMPLVSQTPAAPVGVPGVYDGGYLVFRSADRRFEYWLDGRLMVDGATYSGGENELGDGTIIRRARLGVKATLYRDWYSEIDVDFANNELEVKDAWIGYTGFRNTLLKAGQYKEPFSLETITSSKNIMFMERSYVDNFSPDRNIGVGAARWGKRWQVALGAFGQDGGAIDETARDEGYGITGRVSVAPVLSDRRVVHLGAGLSRRTPEAAEGADTNTVRFRARPETYVSQARFVNTGKVRFVDHTSYYNAEAAVMMGPLMVQGEYTAVVLRRLEDLADAHFSGGYVAASLFLTGDHRKYLVEAGEFDRVHPRSAGGAWELAVRYSTINLNDDDPDVDIMGGKATNYTAGLTWHINTNLKWMLNFVRVETDENSEPDLGVDPIVAGDKFNIIQTRFALAF